MLQEDVEREADVIRIMESPAVGQHIRAAGSDLAAGEVALPRGTRLTAFALGTAAALNQSQVLVFRQPRVTIVCTGDELRPVGSVLSAGTLTESNSVVLAALAQRAGASVRISPLTPDAPSATREQVAAGLEDTDLLLTVGGVSVGDHDVVRPALESAGAQIDFWKVKIKPGKPLVYARTESCTVLGLPGNPVSAQVTFCLFGLPLLRAMQGDSTPLPRVQSGVLAAALRQKAGRLGFHRVRVVDGTIVPLSDQSSGSVSSLARADALALMPADCEHLAEGERVEFLWLDQM